MSFLPLIVFGLGVTVLVLGSIWLNRRHKFFKDLYAGIGIQLSFGELVDLSGKYSKDWQRQIIAKFSKEMLEALVKFQYSFLAPTLGELELRKSKVERFLAAAGAKEISRELSLWGAAPFSTAQSIQDGLLTGTLRVVQGVKLADATQPLTLEQSASYHFERLIKLLKAAGVLDMLWCTSSVRPDEVSKILEAFGYGVANPSAASYGIMAVFAVADAKDSGGEYDNFLSKLDPEMLALYRDSKINKGGVFPFIDAMIEDSVIVDARFIRAWNIIKQSGFKVIDLTGIHSVDVLPTGEHILSTINPVFMLVYMPA